MTSVAGKARTITAVRSIGAGLPYRNMVGRDGSFVGGDNRMFQSVFRRPAISGSTLLVIAAAGLTITQPSTAACAVLDLVPLERLPDGSFSDAGLSLAARRTVVAQRTEAIRRISATFGSPRARPVIVHLSRADALWPMPFNSFGSTSFLPGRTCIVLGPEGRDVDVFAHELVHAEIADRVGYWRRWLQVPTWFDEGAAMQVDYRSAFDLPQLQRPVDTSAIRTKYTNRSFFNVQPERLAPRYAHAKLEVAAWLDRSRRDEFYNRLSELRRGKSFERVWGE